MAQEVFPSHVIELVLHRLTSNEALEAWRPHENDYSSPLD